MGGVYVAVDVGFDSGVHRDDADAADDFGAVGYLRGTEHELVGEEVHVLVDIVQAVVGDAERAGASELDAPFLDEGDDGVLDDFGVHLEGRDARITSQRAQHGVGDVSGRKVEGMMPRFMSAARKSATFCPILSVTGSGALNPRASSGMFTSTTPTIFFGSTCM